MQRKNIGEQIKAASSYPVCLAKLAGENLETIDVEVINRKSFESSPSTHDQRMRSDMAKPCC